MDKTVKNALDGGGVVDITTVGARSGRSHRIEIVFHHFGGSYYITGKPGIKRDWPANMNANPDGSDVLGSILRVGEAQGGFQ